MMKVGDARKASRIASATSADVCVWVRLLNRMKLVTSASVSGRRNALRPNVLMVSVRQLAWAASQVMNFAFAVALPMTWVAINPAALRYPFQVTSVRLPSESAPIRVRTSAPGVMPNRLLITVAYWTFVSRGIWLDAGMPGAQLEVGGTTIPVPPVPVGSAPPVLPADPAGPAVPAVPDPVDPEPPELV